MKSLKKAALPSAREVCMLTPKFCHTQYNVYIKGKESPFLESEKLDPGILAYIVHEFRTF